MLVPVYIIRSPLVPIGKRIRYKIPNYWGPINNQIGRFMKRKSLIGKNLNRKTQMYQHEHWAICTINHYWFIRVFYFRVINAILSLTKRKHKSPNVIPILKKNNNVSAKRNFLVDIFHLCRNRDLVASNFCVLVRRSGTLFHFRRNSDWIGKKHHQMDRKRRQNKSQRQVQQVRPDNDASWMNL